MNQTPSSSKSRLPKREVLRGHFFQLTEEAKRLVKIISHLEDEGVGSEDGVEIVVNQF
jgi:hypothetical protein